MAILQTIANRLAAILPQFTDYFTDKVALANINVMGADLFIETGEAPLIWRNSQQVNLSVGDCIILKNVSVKINGLVGNITNGTGTMITETPHGLTLGHSQNITLAGADQSSVNTTFSLTAPPVIEIASISYDNTAEIATVVTKTPHGFISHPDFKISVQGVLKGDYNETDFNITVIDPTTFTYSLNGTQPDPIFEKAEAQASFTATVLFFSTNLMDTDITGSFYLANNNDLGFNRPYVIKTVNSPTAFVVDAPDSLFLPQAINGELHYNPRINIMNLNIFRDLPQQHDPETLKMFVALDNTGFAVSKSRELSLVDMAISGGRQLNDNTVIVAIACPTLEGRLKGAEKDLLLTVFKYFNYALQGYTLPSSADQADEYVLYNISGTWGAASDGKYTVLTLEYRYTSQFDNQGIRILTPSNIVSDAGDFALPDTSAFINFTPEINQKATDNINLKQG